MPEVRRLVVGMGSYLNINGTLIAVFVFAGAVAKISGAEISLLQLLFAVPLVFLLGYSVPGLPSELRIVRDQQPRPRIRDPDAP